MSRDIDDLDFNSLRSKIIETIGPGTGSFGYGQEIKSSPVFEGNLITKSQWDGLRYDLINILLHQTGVTPNIIEIARGQQVRLSDPLQAYDGLIESARNSRFSLASSQSTSTLIANKTLTTRWNTYAYTNVRITFSSGDEARYFFNSGGKIRFSSSRSGGSVTAQNGAWTNVLNNAGVIEFSAISSGVNFYQLTNSYQTLFETALTTPYSSNLFRIRALSNVANNSTGTATTVTFEINWIDNYSETFPNTVTDPQDQVDGTLSLVVEEVKASGLLQPTGNFAITSPSYQVETIAGGYDAPPPPPPPAPEPYVPPAPPPPVTYNERIILPVEVVQNAPYELRVEGGAPNTEAYFEWRTSTGALTSSGTVSLDGSGNWTSGTVRAFVTPETYTITIRFAYTGNVRAATSEVTPEVIQEAVIVPVSVVRPAEFIVIVTRGVPNSTFGYNIKNSAGTIIAGPSFFTLDGSGNYVSGPLPTAPFAADTYTHTFAFIATNNVIYRTTRLI